MYSCWWYQRFVAQGLHEVAGFLLITESEILPDRRVGSANHSYVAT